MFFAQQDNRPLLEFSIAPLFEDHGIPLAIMGVLVVFLALMLVAAFITVLPRVLAFVAEPPAEAAPPEPATDADVVSDQTLVIIAAAVAATMGKPQRIVRVTGLTPEDVGWSLKGRMLHHQSHRMDQHGRR